MRYLLIFWGGPIGVLLLWYFLSINDLSFGLIFLSREANDYVFEIYGIILGMEPDTIRQLFKRSILIDMVLIAVLVYFKPHKYLKNLWKNYRTEVNLLGKSTFSEKLALLRKPGLFKDPAPLEPAPLQDKTGSASQGPEKAHGLAKTQEA